MVTDLQKRTAEAIVNMFETSRPLGDYAMVTLMAGDAGHLTYGRSQTTLASGNLRILIEDYCAASGAEFATRLAPYLGRLAATDFSLDHDMVFRDLLERAGADQVMHEVQDAFFERVYWQPATRTAVSLGITSALGTAIVYDSKVHGSWTLLRQMTEEAHGTVAALGEVPWLTKYLQERRAWMAGKQPPLRDAVFRVDELLALVGQNKWDLSLPLRVRGRLIDQALFNTVQAPTRRSGSRASGFLIQSTFGQRGNFELVVPHPDGGLVYTSRQNDAAGFPWLPPRRFGSPAVQYQSVSLIQSTFSSGSNRGNLEVLAYDGQALSLFWRGDNEPFDWHGPFPLPGNVFEGLAGNPAMIQSSFGTRGNFELVMARDDGGFSHYWRDNSNAALPWAKSTDVGTADGTLAAITMIEGTFTKPGTLDVIARTTSGSLLEYWREPTAPFAWHGPTPIPLSGLQGVVASGCPSLIQSRYGSAGNYELITPLSDGKLAYLTRRNDDPASLLWSAPVIQTGAGFDGSSVSLLQGNFGTPKLGNFELAVNSGRSVFQFWRDDQPPLTWSAAGLICDF